MPKVNLAEFVQAPERWPMRPMLPMKFIQDKEILCGYLIERQGWTIFEPGGNELESFKTLEDLCRSGWQID